MVEMSRIPLFIEVKVTLMSEITHNKLFIVRKGVL